MHITEQSELDGMPCPDTLIHGECLESMKHIADGSIDMILADLPYQMTKCSWDSVIPFAPLWGAYKRVIKPNGAIVLFGAEPFASVLRLSNPNDYRYDWVWDKVSGTGHLNAAFRPLRCHETVSIFYQAKPTYNPQKYKGTPNHSNKTRTLRKSTSLYGACPTTEPDVSGMKFPRSIIEFSKHPAKENLHPTQKPVALCEYLIKTYTNPGDLVLDNTMGSGTTPTACLNTGRRFIGIELDDNYFDIAVNRVRARQLELASVLPL